MGAPQLIHRKHGRAKILKPCKLAPVKKKGTKTIASPHVLSLRECPLPLSLREHLSSDLRERLSTDDGASKYTGSTHPCLPTLFSLLTKKTHINQQSKWWFRVMFLFFQSWRQNAPRCIPQMCFVCERAAIPPSVLLAFFHFIAKPPNKKQSSCNMDYYDVSSDEEEQCLPTQPEAVDLMVDSDFHKRKGATQVAETVD